MAVKKRIAELERECEGFGLEVTYELTKAGRPKRKKNALVKTLQKHHLQTHLQSSPVPWHLAYMLDLESPMLCERWTEVKEEVQDAIWAAPEWVLEEKFNGCRCLLVYIEGEGLHFYSRHLSEVNYLPNEWMSIFLGDNIPHMVERKCKHYGISSFVLDSEVISTNPNIVNIMNKRGQQTETMLQAVQSLLALNPQESIQIQREANRPLRFWAFDTLHVNNEDLKIYPWDQRREATSRLVGVLQEAGMNLFLSPVISKPSERKPFYDSILSSGGEGCVAKLTSGLYVAKDVRSHRAFVKIKRTVADSIADIDSVDAFVSGWAPGNKGTAHENMIGTVFFSVILNKADGTQEEHEIARISGFSDDTRDSMTFIQEGKLGLNPLYDRKVAAIDGQSVSARERRFTHARLLYWRDDKSWNECTFDEYTLDNLIL